MTYGKYTYSADSDTKVDEPDSFGARSALPPPCLVNPASATALCNEVSCLGLIFFLQLGPTSWVGDPSKACTRGPWLPPASPPPPGRPSAASREDMATRQGYMVLRVLGAQDRPTWRAGYMATPSRMNQWGISQRRSI